MIDQTFQLWFSVYYKDRGTRFESSSQDLGKVLLFYPVCKLINTINCTWKYYVWKNFSPSLYYPRFHINPGITVVDIENSNE